MTSPYALMEWDILLTIVTLIGLWFWRALR